MPGDKETKEVLVAVNEVALVLVKQLKDGVGLDDFAAVYAKITGDAEFREKLYAAYEGISKVPAEVVDLDLGEVIDLVGTQVSYVPKYIAALS
jgi:hypothetical protein